MQPEDQPTPSHPENKPIDPIKQAELHRKIFRTAYASIPGAIGSFILLFTWMKFDDTGVWDMTLTYVTLGLWLISIVLILLASRSLEQAKKNL